jgi:hypothetical protein
VDESGLPSGGQTISLCVDLNVWVRYLLGSRSGTTSLSHATTIVEAAQSGRSAAGPVQLVVSHTMLSRLEDVLVRLGFPSGDASVFCSLIGSFARRGPQREAPHLVLGGGTSPTAESRMPAYDPYDPSIVPPRSDDEDGRVLDTAIAGRANILATYNFNDFTSANTVLLEPGRIQVFRAARHSVFIIHASWVARLLATGQIHSAALGPNPHRDQ